MKVSLPLILSIFLLLVSPVFGEPIKYTPPASDIEKTEPLKVAPVVLMKKGVEITVTPLAFEEPLLSTSSFRGLKSIAVGDGKIHLVRGTGNGFLYSYKLPKNAGEKLTKIGEVGDLSSGHSDVVALTAKGELFVGGYKGTAPIKEGKIQAPLYKMGPLYFSPVTGKGVVAESNGFRLVGNPSSGGGTRVDFEGFFNSKVALPFKNRVALSFKDDKGWFIRVVDWKGQPQFEFGNRTDAQALDGFCWVHGIAVVGDQLIVVDANCRKISVWTQDGKFIDGIKTEEFGIENPWMSALVFDKDGTAYLGVTEQRKGTPEKTVYESVILKIEGLQNLK